MPFSFNPRRRNPQKAPSQQGNIVPRSSNPIQPKTQKTLAELEKELEAEAQFVQTRPLKPSPQPKKKGGLWGKLIGLAVLLGLPVGFVWAVNLPYPPIRRPVAEKAPILLLPSYMSIDRNYREGLTNLKGAEQLLQNTTSAADIELGKEKLAAAKQNFDAIPLWFLEDWPEYDYWWYRWNFDPFSFNQNRAKIGQLEAIAFQEGNAQTSLTALEQGITLAKQQYQQAVTPEAKQAAIAAWSAAIDQLEQISTQTQAGEAARQKLATYQREFETFVELGTANERVTAIVNGAKQFAGQAAQLSQNPPHSAAKWQQIEQLWQKAIDELEQISPNDGAAYAQTQELLATYINNLAQIEIRRQAEQDSAAALETARKKIEGLLAKTPNDPTLVNWTGTSAELQGIIRELEKVQNGTTAYPKAQELLGFTNQKFQELERSKSKAQDSAF